MATVDMELKKAFAELQQQKVETAHKIKIADMQIEALGKKKAHAEKSERDISPLTPDAQTYESVGRMFLLNDVENVRKNLQLEQTRADNKIKMLQENKLYLEKCLKDSEQKIRDMVKIRKDQDKKN